MVAYALTIVGVFLLWRSFRNREGRWSIQTLVACLLMGWGLFNLLEGLIDHQFLGIHHVRDDLIGAVQRAWDIGFLIFAVVLLLAGWWLLRRDKTRPKVHYCFSPSTSKIVSRIYNFCF